MPKCDLIPLVILHTGFVIYNDNNGACAVNCTAAGAAAVAADVGGPAWYCQRETDSFFGRNNFYPIPSK